MPVVQGNVTRCDIRIPNHLYEQIEHIAVSRFDAKPHWKSNKPEVSSTILELIKYGLAALSDEKSDSLSDPDRVQISDIEPMVERIVSTHISDTLSGNLSDISDRASQAIALSEELEKKYQSLSDRLLELERDRCSVSAIEKDGEVVSPVAASNVRVTDDRDPSALKLKAKEQGLLHAELAVLLGVNPSTVGRWLKSDKNGKRTIPPTYPTFWEDWRWDDSRSLWFSVEVR